MNPTPYRARHLADSYTLAHSRREMTASFYAVLGDTPLPALGRHAAYDEFQPTDPETRMPLEAEERAA